jgi:hypothetical protein
LGNGYAPLLIGPIRGGKPQQNVNAKVENVDLSAAHLMALQALNGRRPDDDETTPTAH